MLPQVDLPAKGDLICINFTKKAMVNDDTSYYSSHTNTSCGSSDDDTPTCVVCREPEDIHNQFFEKCPCQGTARIHKACIQEFLKTNPVLFGCPICKTSFQYNIIPLVKPPLWSRIIIKMNFYDCILPIIWGSLGLVSWIITFSILGTIKGTKCTSCKTDESKYCKNINATLLTCLIINLVYYVLGFLIFVFIKLGSEEPTSQSTYKSSYTSKIWYKIMSCVYPLSVVFSTITPILTLDTFDDACENGFNLPNSIKNTLSIHVFICIPILSVVGLIGIILTCFYVGDKLSEYKKKAQKINDEYKKSSTQKEIIGI